jgi:DNA-binding NtrC family response regulator
LLRTFCTNVHYKVHEQESSVDLTPLDPFTFLREFQKGHENIPVIITTGYPDGDLMAEAVRHGPFTLLAKPIDWKHFMQAVRTALKGAREV